MAEHELTRVPFRSWCPHCVAGKSKGRGHFAQDKSGDGLPTLVLDYMWMSDEWEEIGAPIVVGKDMRSKYIFAHQVPKKGADIYAATRIGQELSIMGYKRLIVKDDNEAAIISLREMIRKIRGEDMLIENSENLESRSNGAAEKAVQDVQGQVRAI